MGDKDVISKQLLKRIVKDVSTYLLKLNLSKIEILETVHQRVEERRADMVALVEQMPTADEKEQPLYYILRLKIKTILTCL